MDEDALSQVDAAGMTTTTAVSTVDIPHRGRIVRDIILVISVVALTGFGIASYLTYPQYEVGATSAFYALSNIASFLLGMKGALTKSTSTG
jgi:hypothetical protein